MTEGRPPSTREGRGKEFWQEETGEYSLLIFFAPNEHSVPAYESSSDDKKTNLTVVN